MLSIPRQAPTAPDHTAPGCAAKDRPHPLMQVASRAGSSLAKLDADLRAGGFGRNGRGLASELYASFGATVIANKGTENEAIAWAIARALAIDLYRAGAARGALELLSGLLEFGAGHADPQVLERLRQAKEAIDRKSDAGRRVARRDDKAARHPPLDDRRVVPPPPLRATRRLSRRGGAFAAITAIALAGVALHALTSRDVRPSGHSLSMPLPAATASQAPESRHLSSPSPSLVESDVAEADASKIPAPSTTTKSGPLIDLGTLQGATAIQARLKALGYYQQSVNGVWGPDSAAALSRFRRQEGLGSDGVWDLRTQWALLEK